jgi:hypothetical protein
MFQGDILEFINENLDICVSRILLLAVIDLKVKLPYKYILMVGNKIKRDKDFSKFPIINQGDIIFPTPHTMPLC